MRAFLVAVALALAPPAAAAAKQKVAVLDLRAVQGVAPGTASILSAIVVGGAARRFDVISQSDIATMLGFEKQKQMLGCAEDASCLADIGGALGVDYVLSGQVGQIGSRYHLSLQLLDARRASVASRAARFAERDDDALAAAAQAAVTELVDGIDARARVAPPLPPGAVEPHARPTRPGTGGQPPPAAAERSFWSSRTAAWAALGTGAALVAGGVVFGLQAKAARRDLEDAWRRPDYASYYDDRSGAAKRGALLANVCYGAGAVAAGAGAWLMVRSRPAGVAVAPVVGSGGLGLAAAGTF